MLLSWWSKIYRSFVVKRITQRSLDKAYLSGNSRYLKKVYRYGYAFQKRTAVKHLGTIPRQENFDFLLGELKAVAEIQLRAYLLQSVLLLASHKGIQVENRDRHYINDQRNLLNFIGSVASFPESRSSTAISFGHRRKDLLHMLQDMKDQFEMY